MTVKNNTITQTACGVYLVAFHTWQNSNDFYCGYNSFLDIDTMNNYANEDTHAIGVQGGSRNLYEHNVINGSGGSGITFYQGPDNSDGTVNGHPGPGLPGQEMHDNTVR